MNTHATLTPSQLAFHQAAKERAWRKIQAARRNMRRIEPTPLPAPVRAYVEPIVYPVMNEPEWAVAKTRFDDHITAWRQWKRRQINIAASPIRFYIKRRSIELLSTYDAVMSRSRKHIVVDPRHLIMWEIKTKIKPGMSYPEVGRIFGLDHTSALHACRRIQKIVDEGRLEAFVAEHIQRVRFGPRGKR